MRHDLSRAAGLALGCAFCLALPSGSPTGAAPAPVKETKEAKTSAEDAKSLSLKVTHSGAKRYKKGDQSELEVVLTNNGRKVLALPEMPSHGNRLERCTGLVFILRFENGTVIAARNPYPLAVPDSPVVWDHIRFRPMAVAAGAECIGEIPMENLFFSERGADFSDAIVRVGNRFRLVVAVPALRLQSNPISFNGFQLPKGEKADALDDLELVLKREENERKHREEERQRRFRERLLELDRKKD